MEESAVERLNAKSPEEAIIEQISRDFNLAPFMARTQFEQYLGLQREVGQMTLPAARTTWRLCGWVSPLCDVVRSNA